MPSRDVLLFDAGAQPMQALATRLRRIGLRPVRVKTPEEAEQALLDDRYTIRAALLPHDLPAHDLTAALRRLEDCTEDGVLRFVATGHAPSPEAGARLREAGVEFALPDPVDRHALRFLINRVTADSDPVIERTALRAPADWAVEVRTAGREKPAQVYTISPRGAYLATERPSLRDALVHIALPLPGGRLAAAARVVMTNVPGNLVRRNLPLGMGVRFTGAPLELEQALGVYVEERLRQLRP